MIPAEGFHILVVFPDDSNGSQSAGE